MPRINSGSPISLPSVLMRQNSPITFRDETPTFNKISSLKHSTVTRANCSSKPRRVQQCMLQNSRSIDSDDLRLNPGTLIS